MKQIISFTKTIVSVFLLQIVFSANLSALVVEQGWRPTKSNWVGFSGMSATGSNVCVMPFEIPLGGGEFKYEFYLETLIFLADDNVEAHAPLYLYYNLPNGESNIVQILNGVNLPSFGVKEITQEMREGEGGEEIPPVDYYAYVFYTVCMPECTAYEGCGEFSTQLLTWDDVYERYEPYPIGEGLFPSEVFESDEGEAYHYTEYKEICCSEFPPHGGGEPGLDPCFGMGGIQITPAPDPYPIGVSPCQVGQYITNPSNTNHTNEGYVVEQRNVVAQTSLFPNPASSDITVQYQIEFSGEIKFDCMDAQGRVIESLKTEGYHKGTVVQTFDVSTWQPGVYFIKVSTSNDSQVLRFVKS